MEINKFLNPKIYIRHFLYRLFLPKKSYAQNGEDIILNYFLSGQEKGFYVDVGANHPKRFSNTFIFYKRGWRGINIEPDPKCFRRFLRTRGRDINLNIGIGEKNGVLDLYVFKADTLSTFSKENAEMYQRMGYGAPEIKKIELASLSSVLEKYLSNDGGIDFLSIDAEGFDEIVLNSNNWDKFRPKFIVLETLEFKDEKGVTGKKRDSAGRIPIDEYLKNVGYFKVADTYMNSIYVEKNFAAFKGIGE